MSFVGRVAFRLAHLGVNALCGPVRRGRRARFVVTLRLASWWHRSPLDLVVSKDIRLGRRVRVSLADHCTSTFHVGSGCRVGDDVSILLEGGSLVLGPGVDVRRSCNFFVAGDVELKGRNLLQTGTSINCDDRITIGTGTGLGEYSMLIDSTHRFDGPDEWFWNNIECAAVDIGDHVWVCAKATVTRGVRMGEKSILGANSVAVKDIPAGWVASGVPATLLRPVDGGVRAASVDVRGSGTAVIAVASGVRGAAGMPVVSGDAGMSVARIC